jgi:hypothetical protein
MPRRPSQRELTGTLLACVESEDDDDQELQRLLVVHDADLAEVLRCAPSALSALLSLDSDARRVRVRALIRLSRERRQQAQAGVLHNASLAAAAMLAKLAVWSEDKVELDPRIVLGSGLLGDRARAYVRFDADSLATITVRRAKLAEASKALRFSDLSCWLDATGFRFGWRGSRGGLRLTDQNVGAREAEAVLTVALSRSRPKIVERFRAAAVSAEPRWLADGFNDANLF